uniref:bis(monoacylglycero)phosphate synthase CLN5 n=1 Tax=Myxine glutinosa TaxID=7769 RepID=UPI00358F049B
MARPALLFLVSLVLCLSLYVVSCESNLTEAVARPTPAPQCEASHAFCSSGVPAGIPPAPLGIDIFSVYLLRIPRGDAHSDCEDVDCHIIRPTLGFTSKLTNQSYTLAWYPLFGMWNSMVPHLPKKNNNSPVWCKQGAVCVSRTARGWRQPYITQISGDVFEQLMQWTQTVNKSNLDYGAWTVRTWHALNATMWFPVNDSATFVQRACQQLARFGAIINPGQTLKVTRPAIFSRKPQRLGTASQIFGPTGQPALAEKILRFYRDFQPNQSTWHKFLSSLDVLEDLLLRRSLYFYREGNYWLLPPEFPFVHFITDYLTL